MVNYLTAGIPLQLFALMWSSPDILGLFSNNVVSFSPNSVLRDLLFSLNSQVATSKSWVSVRADSSSAETLEPLKKGCGVWLSKRSARRGRACQGSAAAGLDLLVPVVLNWRSLQDLPIQRTPVILRVHLGRRRCH